MKRRIASAFCFLATVASVQVSNAWQTDTCNGRTRGLWGTATFALNRCSIAPGTVREADVQYAIDEWNSVWGAGKPFNPLVSGSASCTVPAVQQGKWDVVYVNPGSLGSDVGLALPLRNPCTWPFPSWADGDTVGGQVLIDAGLPEGVLGELSTALGARETLIHEFGHILGMNHVNNKMTVMCTTGACGKVGARSVGNMVFNRTETIFPDDTDFVGVYHPGRGPVMDVAASAWELSGSSRRIANSGTTYTLCPGQRIFVKGSIGFKGLLNPSSPVPARIFLESTLGSIFTAGNFSITGGGRSVFATLGFTVTIPTNLRSAVAELADRP